METDTTLVGTYGVVELYAIADIVLNLTLVVNPGHTESEDTVGFNHSFDNLRFLELRMLVVNFFY